MSVDRDQWAERERLEAIVRPVANALGYVSVLAQPQDWSDDFMFTLRSADGSLRRLVIPTSALADADDIRRVIERDE